MTNQEVNEFMHRYLDDDLTKDEAELLMEHLRQAPASAAMFERLKRLNADLEQLPKVTPPISIVDSILPRLEREGLWTDPPVSNTEQPVGAPVEQPVTVAPTRSVRNYRLRSMNKWIGGVIAASIALTVLFMTLPPGGSDQDTADDSNSAESANQIAMSENALSMKMKAADEPANDTTANQEAAVEQQAAQDSAVEEPAVEQQAIPDTAVEEATVDEPQIKTVLTGGPDAADQKSAPAEDSNSLPKSDQDAPFYSFGVAETASVPSPNGLSHASVVAAEGGYQVAVSDIDGNTIYQSAVYSGNVTNLVWSEDSLQMTFDVTADGAIRKVTINLADHTEFAEQ